MQRIIIPCIGIFLIISGFTTAAYIHGQVDQDMTVETTESTEYWALLVAVGEYVNAPHMDIPYMLEEVEDLRQTLLVSEQWTDDHIKVITGKNATMINIFKGFRWLDEKEDENDISIVYFTTHGFPLLVDRPPFDEEDHKDEALATYRGFTKYESNWRWEPRANPFCVLTDDQINYMLNHLESKGICLIVDSCHSGGFNDNWTYAQEDITYNFAEEFSQDVKGRNRVIMTSVSEIRTSGVGFTYVLSQGLQGCNDQNDDGLCSAEEAFLYAKLQTQMIQGINPKIFDDYPGELILTEVELPPSQPGIEGATIGKTDTPYTYHLSSEDPEEDEIQYVVNWGDGTEGCSDFCVSGETAHLSHSWDTQGTYVIRAEVRDKKGAANHDLSLYTATMAENNDVDQRQVSYAGGGIVNKTSWLAQSFIPNITKITDVELASILIEPGFEMTLAIRAELEADDLVTCTLQPPFIMEWETPWSLLPQWIMFEISDIEVTPGHQYYMICSSDKDIWAGGWNTGMQNPYPNGSFYMSEDGGETWTDFQQFDGCFVIYGL